MHLRTYGTILFFLLSPIWASAQFDLKTYDFAAYGFSVPFYANATKVQSNESTQYNFEHGTSDKLFATLQIYPNFGCERADSIFSYFKRYTKAHQDNPDAFQILIIRGRTSAFGWTIFDAMAKHDSGKYTSRNVKVITNGKMIAVLDIVTQIMGSSYKGTNVDEILDNFFKLPIPETHLIEPLNLKLLFNGNVTGQYQPEEKRYYMARCDKLGAEYPFMTFEYAPKSPTEMVADLEYIADNDPQVEEYLNDKIYAVDRFSQFSGSIQKVTLKLKSEMSAGQKTFYFFNFNNKSYQVCLTVPFVQDDGLETFSSNNDIDEASAAIFETRIEEIISSIQKIK
jgi:hypothetical protein